MNSMKHFALMLAILLSLLLPVQSLGYEIVKGMFSCKIKYQKVLVTKNGTIIGLDYYRGKKN